MLTFEQISLQLDDVICLKYTLKYPKTMTASQMLRKSSSLRAMRSRPVLGCLDGQRRSKMLFFYTVFGHFPSLFFGSNPKKHQAPARAAAGIILGTRFKGLDGLSGLLQRRNHVEMGTVKGTKSSLFNGLLWEKQHIVYNQ